MTHTGTLRITVVGFLTAGVACVGDMAGGEQPPARAPTAQAPGQATTPGDRPTLPPPGPAPASPTAPGQPTTGTPAAYDGTPSALRRLSRDELVASMELLTGAAPARFDLPEEPPPPGHGALLTGGLAFIGSEIGKLKQVLGEFAARVAPVVLVRSGCALTDAAQRSCLGTWSTAFAEQAFGRPLRTAESARLIKLFEAAGTREADVAAVESLLGAVLMAPSFLYRTEIGEPIAGKPGLRALGQYEVAGRLSRLATLAPPDAELLQAARGGRLGDPTERTRQFDRLTRTDLGKRALTVLVLEWLGANDPRVKLKASRYLSGLGADFEAAVRSSADATIRKVVLDSAEPTVGGLLSTDAFLADAPIQKVRALAGTGRTATGDTEVTGRAGLMMHPQVLAAHTKEDGASPFQIGVFLREALLCQPIPEPPADAVASARTDVPAGLTQRESLEYRTGGGVCESCHKQFAPLGFAFLPFDPVGRWVKQDPSGKPWDLSGQVPTLSTQLAFQTPGELVRQLAGHPQVHACFARAALQWTLGRALVAEDQELTSAAEQTARDTRGGVMAMLRAIVAAPGFVNAVAPRG